MARRGKGRDEPPKKPKKEAPFNAAFAQLKGLSQKPPASEPKKETPPPRPARAMPSSDEELFLQSVSGARPIGANKERVEPKKTLMRQGPDDEALALMELKSLVDGDTPFSLVESDEFISGLAPGVTHELLRDLKEGVFATRRHLDLHGYHRDEAKEAITRFVTEARKDGERCVLVITGRGKSSPTGQSVLKEALPRWLSRAPLKAHVLAFCTAQPVHGGPGAFYVLLRRPGVRPFGFSP